MVTFVKGWYVVYTKPKHEKKISTFLSSIKIETFLPLVKKLRVWSDRRKYVDEPLFPSYLFIKLESFQDYFKSLEVNGLLYYVREGNKISVVNDTIINNLKIIIADSKSEIEVSSEYISPGKKLIIAEGPFTGFLCEIVQHNSKEKILVRIELLQRNILLDVPSEYLVPLSLVGYH